MPRPASPYPLPPGLWSLLYWTFTVKVNGCAAVFPPLDPAVAAAVTITVAVPLGVPFGFGRTELPPPPPQALRLSASKATTGNAIQTSRLRRPISKQPNTPDPPKTASNIPLLCSDGRFLARV